MAAQHNIYLFNNAGLKVFGEGEWKVRQHGADRRRVWRKLHLAADSATHEIICADLSLSGTTDAQALPGLINQPTGKSGKCQQTVLMTPVTATMRCQERKSGLLSRREAERNTGRTSTMNVTMRWRISV